MKEACPAKRSSRTMLTESPRQTTDRQTDGHTDRQRAVGKDKGGKRGSAAGGTRQAGGRGRAGGKRKHPVVAYLAPKRRALFKTTTTRRRRTRMRELL